MMLVQYIIWGLWYSTLGNFMTGKGFSATEIPLAYSTTAIASMISPFFVGMVADRFFATERVMATLHTLGAVFAILAVIQNSFWPFFIFLLIHTICYMPTLPLANALSFKQLKNPAEEFPTIRVFGSFGWIAAGFIISLLHFDRTAGMFYTTAAFSLGMAFYCMTLPHTPPVQTDKKPSAGEILGLDALALMKDRNVLIFMIGSFLTCIPLTFYFNVTGMYLGESGIEKISMTMTIGQWVEAGFFLIMPIMLRDLGIKKVLLLGMLCWALRLFCFGTATGTTGALIWMIIMGIALHGMAYDFFFVTGQVYIDRKAPQNLRSSAQGLLYFLTLGAGMFVGSMVVAAVNSRFSRVVEVLNADGVYQAVTQYDWENIWTIAAGMAAIVFLMFLLVFKDETPSEEIKRRQPLKAWGMVALIVVVMFGLSFGLQAFFHKEATCAGFWKGERTTAEVVTSIGTVVKPGETTPVSCIQGSFIMTDSTAPSNPVYFAGKIEDLNDKSFINGTMHRIQFPAKMYGGKTSFAQLKKTDADGKPTAEVREVELKTGFEVTAFDAAGQSLIIKIQDGVPVDADGKKITSFFDKDKNEVQISTKATVLKQGIGVINWDKSDATQYDMTFDFTDEAGMKQSFKLKRVRRTYEHVD